MIFSTFPADKKVGFELLRDRFHYIVNEFIGFRDSISRAETPLYHGHSPFKYS